MNALFALALLISPCRAGVVAPVENGVAPAGPSAPVAPVSAPGGAPLGSPSLGSGADLRGAIPVLPAPVPGLLGPVKHFVGETPEAAAARPEAGAVQSKPAPAAALQARASDRTPALPAKPSPGAPSPAINLDRRTAASTLENGASLSRDRRGEAPSNPFADAASIENSRPEKAAGLGRAFFDQSVEKGRGALEDPAAAGAPSALIAATIPEGGALGSVGGAGAGARLSAPNAEAAFGAGHGPGRLVPSYAPEGEILHDAVASVPGAAAGGAAVAYRAAAPNGDLARGAGSPASAAAALPVPGAPRPLAIDLSGAGLIVRVRSALGGAIAPAAPAAAASRPVPPGPSTAFLERGAMLEAFSVAGDYASRAAAESAARQPSAAGVPRAARTSVPSPEPATAPLWWAWLVLPLFLAAVRGIL